MPSTSVAVLLVATHFLCVCEASSSENVADASHQVSPPRAQPAWYVEGGAGKGAPEASGPEWYINHYSDGQIGKIHNVSDGLEWRRDFMSRYAEAYELYQEDAERIQHKFPNVTQRARDCHTVRKLDEWRDTQRERIKAFVPKTFRHLADASLDREFEANKARIAQEQAVARSNNPSNLTGPQVLASAPSSSVQPIMDQYAKQWIPHPEVSGSAPPEWYTNHYAGERVPVIKNMSGARDWRRNFMNRFIEAYEMYADKARRIHHDFANAPQDISDCRTLEELKRWRRAQQAEIKAFVPKTFQQFALDSVEREFEANKARIALHRVGDSASNASTFQLAAGILDSPQLFMDHYADQWMPRPLPDADAPPEWYINHYAGSGVPRTHNVSNGSGWQNSFVRRYAKAYQLYSEESQHIQREFANAPRHAGDCHTLAALREWRDCQRARIEAFVPRAFHKRAEDRVDEEFDSNKARVVREEAREDASNTSRSASDAATNQPSAQLAVGVAEADQEHMSWQDQWIPHPLPDADAPPEWYGNRSAGQWVPTIHNASGGHEWLGNFADRYDQAYQHYVEDSQRLRREFAHAPQHAHDAHNLPALREWRDAQRAQIEAFLPRTFQRIAEGNVDEEFDANKALIEREAAARNASAARRSTEMHLLVGFPDAQNKMGWGEQWMPHPLPNPSTPEQYINHYAGKWVRSPHDVSNGSEWQANFVDGYTQAYRHYFDDAERLKHEFGNATQHARDCHTLAELREWRDAQRAQIEAFMPQTFQRIAKDEVEQQFAKNKARILRCQHTGNVSASNESAEVQLVGGIQHPMASANPSPEWYVSHSAGHWVPNLHNDSDGHYAQAYQQYAEESEHIRREFAHAPRRARDCHTLAALREWRDAQRAQIEAFVPQTLQRMAEGDVDKEFEANEVRIAREGTTQRTAANSTVVHNNHSGTAGVSLLSGAAAAQNLMGWYEQVPHPLPDANTPPEWYVNHFTGQWVFEIHSATNGTEWREHLAGKYSEAFSHYAEDAQRIRREFVDAPQHARDCHTLQALRKWRDAKRAQIQAFVPRTFQQIAKDEVNVKFETNKARIVRDEDAVQRTANVSTLNESAGVQLLVEQEAHEWRSEFIGRYPEAFVPRTFQQVAKDEVDKEFEEAAGHTSNVSHSQESAEVLLAEQTPRDVNHHAGQWVPKVHNVSDDHEWQHNFVGKNAEAYQHYMEDSQRLRSAHAQAPRHASDCHSLAALREWRDAQHAHIEAFVPQTFQQIAEDDVDQEFESNKARIVAEEARQHAGNHSADDSSLGVHAQFLIRVPAATRSHMDWYERWIPHPQSSANATPEWYTNHYAGTWVPKIDNVSNGSDWRNNFMRRYAEAYRHYAEDAHRIGGEFANATQHARDCHTLAELRGWRDAQRAQIEAFVPLAFQRIPLDEVEEEFEANKARIVREEETTQRASNTSSARNVSGRTAVQLMEQASESASGRQYMDQYAQQWIPHPLPTSHSPPEGYNNTWSQQWHDWFMGRHAEAYNHYAADFVQLAAEHPRSPPQASDCHSEEELKAWRRLQSAQIRAFVPKVFQSLAQDSLARACQAQRARLAAEGLSVVGYGATAPAVVRTVVVALVLLLVAAAISGGWVRSRMAEEEIADYYVQV